MRRKRYGEAGVIVLGLLWAVDLVIAKNLGLRTTPTGAGLAWVETLRGGLIVVLAGLVLFVGARFKARVDQRKLGPAAIERSFFWAHSTPALLCDLNRQVVREANVAACRLFGIARADFEGKALADLFLDPVYAPIHEALATQRPVLVAARDPRPGAQANRQFQLSAFLLRESWHTEVAVCCEDVTEERQIKKMLQTFEDMQQAFIRSLPVPVGLYDQNGHFVFGNARFETEMVCHGVASSCPLDEGCSCSFHQAPIDQLVGCHAQAVCATHEIQALTLNLGPCGQWNVRLFPVLLDTTVHVGLLGINEAEAARERQKADNYALLLRALATRALQVRESERAELAREIHDMIGQEVAVMTLDASRLHRMLTKNDSASLEKARDLVGKMEQGVGTIMTTVRRLATTLRPELLNTLGLSEAAISLVSEMRARTGIRATVMTCPGWTDPTDGVALQLYRCLQEAMTNITKHAQASRVTVTLRLEQQRRVMIIEDNGKGIGPREESDVNHLGLVGMSERVLAINGQLTISTRPAFPGTQICIVVPLES